MTSVSSASATSTSTFPSLTTDLQTIQSSIRSILEKSDRQPTSVGGGEARSLSEAHPVFAERMGKLDSAIRAIMVWSKAETPVPVGMRSDIEKSLKKSLQSLRENEIDRLVTKVQRLSDEAGSDTQVYADGLVSMTGLARLCTRAIEAETNKLERIKARCILDDLARRQEADQAAKRARQRSEQSIITPNVRPSLGR